MAGRRVLRTLLVGLVALLGASASRADVVPLDLTIGAGGDTVRYDSIEGVVNGDQFSATGGISSPDYAIQWIVTGDADPFVAVALGVLNNTALPQTFNFVFSSPILPTGPPSLTSGTIGITLTDNDGDGASITSVAGASLYTASTNFSSFNTLLDDPFSLSTAVPFDSAVTSADFGVPGPSYPGPLVTVTEIGIQLQFILSAHDSASLSGNFVIEQSRRGGVVPEPATVSLLGVGLVGMAARKLRRGAKA